MRGRKRWITLESEQQGSWRRGEVAQKAKPEMLRMNVFINTERVKGGSSFCWILLLGLEKLGEGAIMLHNSGRYIM